MLVSVLGRWGVGVFCGFWTGGGLEWGGLGFRMVSAGYGCFNLNSAPRICLEPGRPSVDEHEGIAAEVNAVLHGILRIRTQEPQCLEQGFEALAITWEPFPLNRPKPYIQAILWEGCHQVPRPLYLQTLHFGFKVSGCRVLGLGFSNYRV